MKKLLLGFAILLSITLLVPGGAVAQQDTDFWRIGDTPGETGATYGWRVDGRGHLVPVTGDQVNIGASTQEVNYGFFTNITLGGTNKSSWGSVVSPMTDAAGYVYPTDSNGYLQLRDDGDLRIGGGVATDVEIRWDGNADDFIIALDDSADDLVIAYGSTVGTDNRITIVDDANNSQIVIGDGTNAYDHYIRFDGNAQDYTIAYDDTYDYLVFGSGTTVATPCAAVPSGATSTSPQLFLWHGIDGYGAIDIDYGSADITDHQFTSDGGVMQIDGATLTLNTAVGADLIYNHEDDTIGVQSNDADTVFEIGTVSNVDAILQLQSDDRADAGDIWQIKNDDADSNALLLLNDITAAGTLLPKVEISTAGAIMASADVTVINHDTSTNSVQDMITFQHDISSGSAADTGDGGGIGAGITFDLENSAGTIEEHGSIDLVCRDVTDATEDSSFVFSQMSDGLVRETLRLEAGRGHSTADVLQWTSNTAETDSIVDVARFRLNTTYPSATPATNIAMGFSFHIDNASRSLEEQASIDFVMTDADATEEDVDIAVTQCVAGTLTERVRFDADGAALILKGATPQITIGDAGAEDSVILFDGNATDFRIGIHDVNDELVICNSTMGNDPAIEIETDEDVNIKQDLVMENDNRIQLGGSNIAAGGVMPCIEFDQGVDRQVLFMTEATYCVGTGDPIFEFLAATNSTNGAAMTVANQEVFGIAKGTQANNRRLFAVDGEGDVFVTGDVVCAATALIVNTSRDGGTTSLTHKYRYYPIYLNNASPEIAGTGAQIMQCVGCTAGVVDVGTTEGYVDLQYATDVLRFRIALPETFVQSTPRTAGDLLISFDAHEQATTCATAAVSIYEQRNTTAILTDELYVTNGVARGWLGLDTLDGGIGADADINADDILTITVSTEAAAEDLRIYGVRLEYRTGIQATQ